MVHKKQFSNTKRLAANKIIDLIYAGKLKTAYTLLKTNFKPNNELYYFLNGWISQLQGRHDIAVKLFEKALILNPLNDEVLTGLAGSYLELEEYDRAEECASHAVTVNSSNPKNLLTLATVVSKSNKSNKTVQAQADILFERAFNKCIEDPELNNKLLVDILSGWGGCLLNLEELAQAKIILEKAISYDPYNTIAHKNLISVYANTNKIDLAIASAKIACMSDDSELVLDTIYQEGMLELLRGNYARGWRMHEARLETAKYRYKDLLKLASIPFSDLTEHNSVLLFQEQGIGDLLQFSHYIPLVHDKCKNIDIVVLPNTFLPMLEGKTPSPKEFIEHNFSKYIRNVYIRGVDKITESYDSVVAIMSLGSVFKTTDSNKPKTLPFTSPIKNTNYKNKVGIFWKGSSHHPNDSLRSVPTKYINNLISSNPNIDFVSLQIDRDDDLKYENNIVSAASDMGGLLNTLSVIEQCSLIISVDSMVAHLAAGANKSVWMLHAWSPDWRWGLYGDTNRWYDSATDIRQSEYKNWDNVFATLNDRLKVFKNQVDGC